MTFETPEINQVDTGLDKLTQQVEDNFFISEKISNLDEEKIRNIRNILDKYLVA